MFEVVRVSDRIILIRMTIGKTVFVFVCVYAPQANLSEFEKDRFYQMLQCTESQHQNSSFSLVTGMGTYDPSLQGSRRCMADRPLEKGTLRVREY